MTHPGAHIEIEIVIGEKVVRERRAQLARRRKQIVLDELEEPVGEYDLGDVDEHKQE